MTMKDIRKPGIGYRFLVVPAIAAMLSLTGCGNGDGGGNGGGVSQEVKIAQRAINTINMKLGDVRVSLKGYRQLPGSFTDEIKRLEREEDQLLAEKIEWIRVIANHE